MVSAASAVCQRKAPSSRPENPKKAVADAAPADGYNIRLACLAVMSGEAEVIVDIPEIGAERPAPDKLSEKPEILAALDVGTDQYRG